MNHAIANRKNPFRIPDGYLESVPERILTRIDAEQSQNTVFRRSSRARILNMYVRYATGIAAAVIFFVMFVQSNVAQMEKNQESVSAEMLLASASDMVYDYMMLDDQIIYDDDDIEE